MTNDTNANRIADAHAVEVWNDNVGDWSGTVRMIHGNRTNEYYHERGDHANGAISTCASCVLEGNVRALSADALARRENAIRVGRMVIAASEATPGWVPPAPPAPNHTWDVYTFDGATHAEVSAPDPMAAYAATAPDLPLEPVRVRPLGTTWNGRESYAIHYGAAAVAEVVRIPETPADPSA